MPNYCDNDLYIYGPQDDRDTFVNAAESYIPPHNGILVAEPDGIDILDFNNFVPYPQEFKDLDEVASNWYAMQRAMPPEQAAIWEKNNPRPTDGYNQGGYDWCVKNWGTKWNACSIQRTENKTSLKYHFQTAWSPPIPVVKAMAAMFPTLTFKLKYFEGGMGFQGVFEIKGDKIIQDLDKPYSGNKGG